MNPSLTQEQWIEKVKRADERLELKSLDPDKFVYPLDGAIVKMGYKGEYDVGRLLFENRVNAPKMYSFVDVGWRQYIVMQRLNGTPLTYIPGKMNDFPGIESSELLAKLREELRKVMALGIVPKDGDWHGNSLFVLKERKVYLIDFGRYYRGSREELEAFEKRLHKENFLRFEPEF